MARGDRSRSERTSEERERDRVERERRRAERAGTQPPPEPDPADPLPFEEPPHLEAPDPGVEGELGVEPNPVPEPLEPVAPPEHVAPEPEAVAPEPEPEAEPEPEPEAVAPAPEPEPEPVPAAIELPPAAEPEHGPFADEPLAAEEVPPAAEPEPEAHEEPEPQTHEEPALDPATHAEPEPAEPVDPHATQAYEIPGVPPEDPAPPPPEREASDDPSERRESVAPSGLPAPPPRIREPRERPTRRAFRRGSAPVVAGAAPSAIGAGRNRRRGVASRLAALVALAAVAVAVVLLVHSLKGSSHPKSPAAVPVVKVLIPEGKTRVQIAQIAQAAGLKGSYRVAAKKSELLNPKQYGAPASTPDLEGFLFPATYDMDKGAPASRLVEEQLTAFQENFGTEDVSRAKALGVTPYGLLTVASMVEREAQVPGDRAKIAAVIYNRLKAGMPLGIDAAIYYAVEMEKNVATYTHELTESQLKIDSPYNTRTHTGLPPTPISNPGTASIQAAAHPAHVSYLYYVAGADGCGEQVFSTSQSSFEANVAAYEEAKRKNGGKPPTCKKH